MNRQALLKLPFDQYSRQKIASELLEALRSKGQRFKILDVGGYKGVTGLFHSGDNVTVLDVFDVTEKNYIKGDATAMEFADSSYDFVVSFDVFEHIPRAKREAFARECTRVAKRGVIIAAPVGTPQNDRAERFLNDLFRDLHGKEHPWLQEHIDYRLPELGLSSKLLRKQGLHTFDVTSNYLPHWVLMQAAIFAASKFDKVGREIDNLYVAYNEAIYPDGGAQAEESYRVIACGVKSERDARAVERARSKIVASRDQDFDSSLAVIEKVTTVLNQALESYFEDAGANEARMNEVNAELVRIQADNLGQRQQIELLKNELDRIKNSRSFRLAAKLSAAKNYPHNILKRDGK